MADCYNICKFTLQIATLPKSYSIARYNGNYARNSAKLYHRLPNDKGSGGPSLNVHSCALLTVCLIFSKFRTYHDVKRRSIVDEKQNIGLRRPQPTADVLESCARTHDVGPRRGLGLGDFDHISH